MATSQASIRWPTSSASRTADARGSVRRVRLGAGEVELHRFFGSARVHADDERHAGRRFEIDRLVLDAIAAEDEMSEGFVRDHLLPGAAGLGEVHGRGRIFGRGVLIAFEGEVEKEAGR